MVLDYNDMKQQEASTITNSLSSTENESIISKIITKNNEMWKQMEESFKVKMETMEKEMNKNKVIFVTKDDLEEVNKKVEDQHHKIKEIEHYAKETQEAIENIATQNRKQNEGIDTLSKKIDNQNRGIIDIQKLLDGKLLRSSIHRRTFRTLRYILQNHKLETRRPN